MRKKYISERAWRKIFKILKESKLVRVGSEESCRNFVEAVFWILRSGAPWRMLPEQYGKWNSIYKRFNIWSKKGIWMEVYEGSKDVPDQEYIMIDSTLTRAHPCAAGYGKQSEQGLGRSRGGFTSKIHAVVDAHGLLLSFNVTPGNRNDITQAELLIPELAQGSYVIADKGYDSDELRLTIQQHSAIPVIPFRSSRKSPRSYDKHIYRERHLIECLFSKIKQFRRVFSRFEKALHNYVSFIAIAAAHIWLR